MKQTILWIMVVLALCLTACGSKKHSSVAPEDEPRTAVLDSAPDEDTATVADPSVPVVARKGFSLVMTSPDASLLGKRGLAKSGAVAVGEEFDFFMGVIKQREDYAYILTNNSDKPLTGITVTSSNAKFLASPSTIKSIGAPTQGVGASVLVKVDVLHGESAGGRWAPPVTESEASTTLTVSGMYGDSAFTVSYTIGVTPSYVEVVLASGNTFHKVSLIGHNCPISYLVKASGTYEPTVETAESMPADREGYAMNEVSLSTVIEGWYYADCASGHPSLPSVESPSNLNINMGYYKL
jgi:predicted small lipoprotein YifL